jgi:hypothetical protein
MSRPIGRLAAAGDVCRLLRDRVREPGSQACFFVIAAAKGEEHTFTLCSLCRSQSDQERRGEICRPESKPVTP